MGFKELLYPGYQVNAVDLIFIINRRIERVQRDVDVYAYDAYRGFNGIRPESSHHM